MNGLVQITYESNAIRLTILDPTEGTSSNKCMPQEAFLGLPWVWIRTFGPRELGLWV